MGRSDSGIGVPLLIAFDRVHRNHLPHIRRAYDTTSFRAQYQLQTVQCLLESSATQFVQTWIPLHYLVVGSTCPKALELHKFFKFVAKHRHKMSSEQCHENSSSIQNLHYSIASIRHAAIHRLPQDKDHLLQMHYAAIEFVLCVGVKPQYRETLSSIQVLTEDAP